MEPLQIIAQSINDILDSLPKRPSTYGTLDLSKEPLFLKRTHRYSQVFLTNPIDLCVDIPLFGEFLLTLPVGWHDLSLPENARVALASGGSLSALYRSID